MDTRQNLVVLILVVVEDGLRVKAVSVETTPTEVLILVVVEDGLRDPTVYRTWHP